MAIIIPGFKREYLKQTLNSIFSMKKIELANVYVFDDNSPNELYEICNHYENKDNFKYHRYNENYGGKDLVAQWNRCVRDTKENWVWLFSDDDIVTENCLVNFFESLKSIHLNTLLLY